MKLTLAICATLSAGLLGAQPVINSGGIVNAASSASPGLPNSAIAQGSIFVIYGQNLGPAQLLKASAFPLPTTLSGTSVEATVNGKKVAAFMLYTWTTQVAAVLPSNTPTGQGTITVTYNGRTSAPEPVQVASNGFGIFTLNQGGTGPAVVTDTNFQVITLTHAAQPGQTLVLWGTGLGAIKTRDDMPPPVGDFSAPATVWVGSQQATVLYHGRTSCCAGLDQVNFIVPSGVTGCYVPIALQMGSTPSNFGSIAVSGNGDVCSDPNGLSASQLHLVASGVNLRLGTVNLVRSVQLGNLPPPFPAGNTISDYGSASFALYTPQQADHWLGPFPSASPGNCMVFPASGDSLSVLDPTQPQGLDAGLEIRVSGANGTKQLTEELQQTGFYTAFLGGSAGGVAPYLDPGSYTFSATGGADVGAFQGQVQMPPAVTWTNAAAITTVDRSQGVTLTWTGGAADGFVYISGYSVAQPTSQQTTSNASAAALFLCSALASAGKFTVPPVVLLALPPSGIISGSPLPLGGMGLVSVARPKAFTAAGLDVGLASASLAVSQITTFK